MMNPSYVANAEWKIIQNTSEVLKTHSGTQGKLFNSIDQTFHDSAELIFVDFKVSRRFFNKDDRSSAALCFSEDGVRNAGGQLFKPCTQACDLCPHSQWKAKNEQPDCTFMFNYGVISPGCETLPIPAFLSLSKTSISVAKQFNSLVMRLGKPLYFYVFQVSSTLMQMAKGSAYVPVFTCVRETTEKERFVGLKLSKRLASLSYAVTQDEA